MKLDKRIKEGKRPLTCFDIDEARKYVGKLCYVSNSYDCFRDLKNLVEEVILIDVEDCETPFHFYIDNQREFCLPAEWVKESEKTYRPYTVMEFIKEYPLGSHLRFRPKSKTMEMHRLIDGYNDCLNGSGTLFLCGAIFSMLELYDNYEIFKDGEWKPFGIEVEDEE